MQIRYSIRALTDEVKKLTEELEKTFSIVKSAKVLEARRLLTSLNQKLKRQDAVIYHEEITIDAIPKVPESISKKEILMIIDWAQKTLPVVEKFMPATVLEERKIAEEEQRRLAEKKAEEDQRQAELEREKKKLEEIQKEEKKKEAPKDAPAKEKMPDPKSVELMELANQMPTKYKELTSKAKRALGRIPGVKKTVISHAANISDMIKKLNSLEDDSKKTKFQKQIECVLDHFETQNISYNRSVSKRAKKPSKLGIFNKPHADNLPDELNLYNKQHHYTRMLATLLQVMVEKYGRDIDPKTVAKINTLVSKVQRQDYFVLKDVGKSQEHTR
ncbi:MAG: hypothetical protein ACYCQI_16495 [Gammaproteobacteria bacterium]